MIANSNVPREIDALLPRLRDETTAPPPPSRTFDLLLSLESALRRNEAADRDPQACGWPPELEEPLRKLRDLEERLAVELRGLMITRALEPNRERRMKMGARIRERLVLLRRYARREAFLFLSAFWLDLGVGD